MGRTEQLILQHSGRGMELLRPFLSDDFCADAAKEILSWPKGTVLLTTGFYVAGKAETDGPAGTLFLAKALEKLGYTPVVLTDEICRGYFEQFSVAVQYIPVEPQDFHGQKLLDDYRPVGLIAVERCGRNIHGDYANMRGVSIAPYTAPLDWLFVHASVPTVGIGDGGNEIGMGNLAAEILENLSLVPCEVNVDHLVISTVSNWGALGLCAELGHLPQEEFYLQAYAAGEKLGFVDGVTKEVRQTEDGFSLETGKKLLDALKREI